MPSRRLLAGCCAFVLAVAACGGDADTAGSVPATTLPPSTSATSSPTTAPPTTSLPSTSAPPTTGLPTTPPLASATTLPLPVVPAGSVQTVTLDIDGRERTYRLYVPPQAENATEPVPLVVDLHGFTSTPDNHDQSSEMRALADVAGFAVAQPAARGAIAAWNPQPGEAGAAADVAFIRALVADVDERVGVDPGAVFASGFSNGGGMVHRLACDAADLLAAVGTVAGQYPLMEECDPVRPVPIISFHGTEDLVVPITGVQRFFPNVTAWVQRWAERNGCAPVPARTRVADDVVVDEWTACDEGAEVIFFTIEGGGHAWPGTRGAGFFDAAQSVSASQEMWTFFMRHAQS